MTNIKLPYIPNINKDTVVNDVDSVEDDSLLNDVFIIDTPIRLIPLPPSVESKIDYNNFYSNYLLCKIEKDNIEYNKKKINHFELYRQLKKQIETNDKLVLNIYFSENMSYEKFLSYYTSISEQYYQVRNEYSKLKYNEIDYEMLDMDKQKDIRKKHPMRIRQIGKDEYEEIRTNAM